HYAAGRTHQSSAQFLYGLLFQDEHVIQISGECTLRRRARVRQCSGDHQIPRLQRWVEVRGTLETFAAGSPAVLARKRQSTELLDASERARLQRGAQGLGRQ